MAREIQPAELAVIREIHVEDGQTVAAGDPLITLDPGDSRADVERLAYDLMAAQVEAARLQAMLDAPQFGPRPAAFPAPDGAPPQLVAVETQIKASRFAAHDAAMASLDSEEARLWAEQASAEIQIAEALVRQLEGAIARLAHQDHAPRLRLLEAHAQRISAEHRLLGLGDKVGEITASLWTVDTRRSEAEAAFRNELLQELAAASSASRCWSRTWRRRRAATRSGC